jgi:hypothetical protein
VDQHALAFDPADPRIVYAGNDGGIFRSLDGGGSWSSLNTNLALTQFYEGVSLHPWNPSVALGGTQDNGTIAHDGSFLWNEVLGGDGGYTAIDPHDPATWYGETQWFRSSGYSGPRRSDGGGFFLRVNGINLDDRALFIPPLEMDPVDSRTLYFGTYRVYRTTDRAETWTAISPDLSAGGAVSAIGPAAGDPLRLYVGTSDGRVQTTSGGGQIWTPRVIPSSGARYVQHIAVDPRDPLTAYVAVSGFITPHLFRTVNGGSTFSDVSGNLPDVPVNAVVLDPTSRGIVLIGTDLGVFASSDSGGSWAPLTDGMPNVAVFDLTYNVNTGVLVAATHGRGMFALQLDRPLTLALVSAPGAARDTAVVGDTDVRSDSATVILSGPGAATAPWTAGHGAAGWISFTTSGGTGTGVLSWNRDPSGLAAGTHVDTITVVTSGAFDSPWRLIDSLVVLPRLAVAPDTLRSSAIAATLTPVPAQAQVLIRGAGAGATSWTATKDGAAWLALTTSAGVGSSVVRWNRMADTLRAGSYTGSILITSSRGDTARLTDLFTITAPEVGADCAADELMGTTCLDETRRRFLDLEGNRDGVYNLGDFLARLARGARSAGAEGKR